MAVDSTSAMEYRLGSYDNPRLCDKALALVDAGFRAIPSLQEIVIEIYEEGLDSIIRRKMESQGWKLIVVERAEDEEWDIDRTWDEIEGEEYFDDYDDDEYDIDNDSDFWRRAAD